MGTAIKASGYKQLCYNFATPDFLLFLFLIKKNKKGSSLVTKITQASRK